MGSTFHSVYISTMEYEGHLYTQAYLHSTLFILVRFGRVSSDLLFFHLHSTLFILVLYHLFLYLLVNKASTFHSVYISTLNGVLRNIIVINLHSTLFILVHVLKLLCRIC